MPADGRGPLKLMRLFPLMFFRVGKGFRSLVKIRPALQILSPSQCSEEKNPVCGGRMRVEVQGTNKGVANLVDNIQLLGNVSTEKRWREDKVTDLVAPAPLPCTHMSSLEGSCPVLCLLQPLLGYLLQLPAKSALCKTNIFKHTSSYPKGVFCWAFVNIKINYIIHPAPNFIL